MYFFQLYSSNVQYLSISKVFFYDFQLISDAGYQGEITSVSTACQQLEVFSRVLRTSLSTLLDGGEQNLEKNLPEFAVSFKKSITWYCYSTTLLKPM